MAHIQTWVVGLALALAIAFVAWRTGSLSPTGAAAAAIVGTIAVAAGSDWGILLITYFASSAFLTRFRAADKGWLLNGRVDKGGARDATQVVANGGVFTGAALGFVLSGDIVWQLVAAGALAASAADTWATEIGTLSRMPPRSIVTWRRVEVGTSGAITALGVFAGLGGAIMVAITANLVGWPLAASASALAGGIVGCFFDSILGASLQARRWCPQCESVTEQAIHRCGTSTSVTAGLRWLDNDGVNALSTLIGALFGVTVVR